MPIKEASKPETHPTGRKAQRMTTDNTELTPRERPTLLRALISFVLSVAVVVALIVLLGKRAQPVGTEVSGTYVVLPRKAGSMSASAQFATSRLGLHFVDGDRVEVSMDGHVFDAVYRLEHDQVLIEAISPPTDTKLWIFDIRDDSLVSDAGVLQRVID